ncbi:MAG: TonB-dependent receptor, partial [Bacteroidota bacterium]
LPAPTQPSPDQVVGLANFVRDGTDVSGQQLPGTAPHVANLVADFALPTGFYANLNWNYTDAIPLNDANTVFGEAYHLVRARLGWRGKRLEVFAGGSNLLDQRMSFGNDLNPRFGNRYFQPAPGINGFVGVRWWGGTR